jgi:hypothetical protein
MGLVLIRTPLLALLLVGTVQIRARDLPSETAGIDRIVQALLSVFDQSDILALGESHWNKLDADLRLRLVRHPDFAKKVRFVVVEFASSAQQKKASFGSAHPSRRRRKSG